MQTVTDPQRGLLHVRLAGWFQEHPVAGSAIIVTMLAPVPLLITAVTGTRLTWGLLLLLPLYLRPLRPALAAVVFAALALLGLWLLSLWPFAIGVWGAPWLLHTVAARCERRVRLGVLAVALITCVVSSALWPRWWLDGALSTAGEYTPTVGDWIFGTVLLTLLTSLVMISAHLTGDLRRVTLLRRAAERERAEALEERARRLEIERDQEVRLAAQDERTRIAREMHDIVAHSLSVVIAQADGARYAAQSAPSAASEALGTIAATARGSLAEMRGLLGVLRTDEAAERAPVPTIDDLPALVDSVRRTGLDIRLRISPEQPPGVGSGASLAVYRLAQEGLTNTLKHSPDAAWAEVEIVQGDADLLMRVTSDGLRPSAAPSETGGQGLRGLRERFGLYGGQIEAGPDPSAPEHWVLSGSLPASAAAPSTGPLPRLSAETGTPTSTQELPR